MAGGAILLAACGGGGQPGAPTPPAPPLARGIVLQAGFALEPGKVTYVDFEVPARHNFHITVDWTFASNNVLAVMTASDCPDVTAALQARCVDRTTSWAPSFPWPNLEPRKPRLLSYDPINMTVPARLWIANAGATSESGTIEVRYCAVPPDCGRWGMCLACWGG
jgi:hypothetical protein